jgi:hypothetical protein
MPIIPPDSYKQQMKGIKMRKSNKKPVFLACKKIRLYLTFEQKEILDKWFYAFARMFNVTINYVRSEIFVNGKLNIETANKICNFRYLRQTLHNEKNSIQQLTQGNLIPIHILDEAINQAASNYKTCLTNLKKGHIKKFRVREWAHHKRRKIIKIEPSFFKNKTFCQNIFPIMESSESLTNINRTTTLQYDSNTKKYILLVPYAIDKKKIIHDKLECGIDPGVRTFATVYSKNNTYAICNKKSYLSNIKKHHKKIDKINELLQIKSENKEITTDDDSKPINRSSLLKALRKHYGKIKNKIKDMHFKISYELVNTFDSIYLGKFNIPLRESARGCVGSSAGPDLYYQKIT